VNLATGLIMSTCSATSWRNLRQMEEELGYLALSISPISPADKRLYIDLKPVPSNNQKQLIQEYQELKRIRQTVRDLNNALLGLPQLGESFMSKIPF
jgi:hypothetical protein